MVTISYSAVTDFLEERERRAWNEFSRARKHAAKNPTEKDLCLALQYKGEWLNATMTLAEWKERLGIDEENNKDDV